MSHRSDQGYYKQPIKLPLVKVNHVSEDFILMLKRPSLFSYKQKHVFLYWPYSDIANASFAMVEPGLCEWVSKEFRIRSSAEES